MTDRQLANFLTVAEKQSFTAAAESLYISQSALSQQISQLEQQLGFQLFDRGRRRATLTEAGRSFYQNARKMREIYLSAVAEGQRLQQLSEQHVERFCIGCLGDQFYQIWQELLRTALPLADRYLPRPVRYESREALYLALLQGEAQIAAMLENEEITHFGLQFMPFASVPELCMPSARELEPERLARWNKDHVTLEDLEGQLLAFHNRPGACLYEDQLRKYLRESRPGYEYVDPDGFFTAGYRETFLLVPAIQYSGHAFVMPLDWQGGARLGFVTAQGQNPHVQEYANYIRDHLQAIPCFWEPLRECVS